MSTVDYKALYLHSMQAMEHAIRVLIATQRECEELYLQQTDSKDPLYEQDYERTDTARSSSNDIEKA